MASVVELGLGLAQHGTVTPARCGRKCRQLVVMIVAWLPTPHERPEEAAASTAAVSVAGACVPLRDMTAAPSATAVVLVRVGVDHVLAQNLVRALPRPSQQDPLKLRCLTVCGSLLSTLFAPRANVICIQSALGVSSSSQSQDLHLNQRDLHQMTGSCSVWRQTTMTLKRNPCMLPSQRSPFFLVR